VKLPKKLTDFPTASRLKPILWACSKTGCWVTGGFHTLLFLKRKLWNSLSYLIKKMNFCQDTR
jgi:hypothetical protein